MFKEIKANKSSISKRKPVFGFGINNADYIVRPSIGGRRFSCPYYQKWWSMMARCYSKEYQEKRGIYIDVYVCEEWLTFLNFKEWMAKQDWQGKELDKDIIKPGNKIYSSEFCAFVSSEINSVFTGKKKGHSSTGVYWNKAVEKYHAQIQKGKDRVSIGFFDSAQKAELAYRSEKANYISYLASVEEDNNIKRGLIEHCKLLTP